MRRMSTKKAKNLTNVVTAAPLEVIGGKARLFR